MGGALDSRRRSRTRREVSGDVLSEFGPEMVELVADVARNPRSRSRSSRGSRPTCVRELAIAKTSPQQIALEKFRAVLYAGHAYGRLFPTPR